jgi:hypothetical protein
VLYIGALTGDCMQPEIVVWQSPGFHSSEEHT